MRARQTERPRAAVVSAVLWFASCAAGVFALVATMMDGDALRAKLTAAATETDPAASAELIRDGVRTTILLVLGLEAMLVVLTLVGTLLLLRRRAWSRWLLLGTGLLTLFVADVAQSVVTGGVDLDRIALLVQLCLVVAAVIALFLRPTRTWLRGSSG
jgi:glucan phosphoethanolaminetransferase (alkaline phosphatase superfamily)